MAGPQHMGLPVLDRNLMIRFSNQNHLSCHPTYAYDTHAEIHRPVLSAIYDSFCKRNKPEIYEIYMQNSRIAGIGKKSQILNLPNFDLI
jgi:hypothetical protein